MSDPASAPSEAPVPLRGLIAAVAAIGVASFGMALTHPLFAVLMEAKGISGGWIGFSTATLAIGMMAGGLFMPMVLRHVGVAPLMAGAAVTGAALLLLARVFDDYWVWTAIRMVYSFCAVALFYGSEVWVLSLAPPHRRGFWIGLYGFAFSVGFFAGPALLALTGTAGWQPFLMAAAMIGIATVPIALAHDLAPRGLGSERTRIADALSFFRSDPVLVWAVVVSSAFEFGALGLLPVWGLRSGMEEAVAVGLVAIVPLGNIVLELPMGMMSDRFSRLRLMQVCALAAFVCAVLMPVLADWPLALSALLFGAGGLVIGLYVFPMAEFAARYSGPKMAQANGAIIFAYGLGSLVSPVLLGQLLDLFPPHGLAFGLAAITGAYLLLIFGKAAPARA